MIEIIDEELTLLYQVEMVTGSKAKMNVVRRIERFPYYLMDDTKYLQIVSPDFSVYIDESWQENMFKLVDTIQDEVIAYIPYDIMPLNADVDSKEIINRFQFLSGDTFKIVNEEGFEKVIK